MASNILAERLEGAGLIHRQADPADGRRAVYRLTRKGLDLAPVLVEIVVWATRYEETDAPAAVAREMKTNRDQFIADLEARWAAEDRGCFGMGEQSR